jgi:hypothetical protein
MTNGPLPRHRRLVVLSALISSVLLAACSVVSPPTTPPASTPADPGTSASAAGPDARTRAEEQFTPVTMDVLSTPSWFTGSDDRVHLVYELRLINASPIEATVREVTVRDAKSDRVIAALSGAALTASMSLQPTGAKRLTKLAPATVGTVWFDVRFEEPSQVPAELDHQLTIAVPPGLPVPGVITSTGAPSPVNTRPPTVVGPPLRGPGWVALGSCCDGPHRRAAQPVNNGLWLAQRYAIDFNRINEQNLLATGPQNRNESWPTYDQPVLAVADAKVVVAANDQRDQIPNAPKPVTIAQADGNYVILEIADGVYAFYAHLKPGTVNVKAGETVTKGQEIGRTGNSGSSTGPHLHFQLMDRPSALLANGIPYVFDRFTVEGQAPPLADIVRADPESTPIQIDTATAGPRTDELPLGRDVIEFPTP